MEPEVTAEGVAALSRSLAQMVELLAQRDQEIKELREDKVSVRAECTRLRRELNAAHAAKAEKMMDVAMEASVQALSDEAAATRRAVTETCVLHSELSFLELTYEAMRQDAESRMQWMGPWRT